MRKIALVLCLFVMLCALPASAAEYPAAQGTATDLAGVLSASTVSDLEMLSERYDDAVDGKLYVLTRHFLGGADARAYAKELFTAWDLDDDDALLLLVIGEEDYALHLGDKAAQSLPSESRSVLLGTYFRDKYLARDYDGAVGDTMSHLTSQLARAKGETVSTDGLFGSASAPAQQPQALTEIKSGIDDLWNSLFSYEYEQADTQAVAQEDAFNREDESTGFSMKRLIIFAVIVYFLFFRKKRRRYNFSRRR